MSDMRRATWEKRYQYRQYNKYQKRRERHSAHHDDGQRLLNLRTDPPSYRGRQEPSPGDDAGHQNGAYLERACLDDCLRSVHPGADEKIVLREDDNAVHDGYAEKRDESDRRRYAEWHTGNVETKKA